MKSRAEEWRPSGTASSGTASRNTGIDVLRGLSIVLVILHHVGLRIPLKHGVLAPLLPKWFLNFFIWYGPEAVVVFFVISGFLIASNSLARWGTLAAIDARAFYRRRAARILPCLFILIAVLSALHLRGVENYVIDTAKQSLPRAIFSAIGLHLNWYEGQTGYLPASWDVLWSLSIEEAFYLGFPVACLLLGRTRLFVPALALLALSLPATRAAIHDNEIWQEKAYLPGMAAIAMGVLAALLVARRPAPRKSTTAWTMALGIVGLVAVFFGEDFLWPQIGNGCMLLLTFTAAALLAALHWRHRADAPKPVRAFGWLRSFGRLSYEVYLTHMFAVWPTVALYRAYGGGPAWGFAWYVPALAGSWALGWLVARFISAPAERAVLRLFAGRAPPSGTASPIRPVSA